MCLFQRCGCVRERTRPHLLQQSRRVNRFPPDHGPLDESRRAAPSTQWAAPAWRCGAPVRPHDWWVEVDMLEGQPVGWCGACCDGAVPRSDELRDPARRPSTAPDLHEAARDDAHLVTKKRLTIHDEVDLLSAVLDHHRANPTKGVLSRAPGGTKARKVVQPDQFGGRVSHRCDVERAADVPAALRPERAAGLAHQEPVPIDLSTATGSGVEAPWCGRERQARDVGGQEAVQPSVEHTRRAGSRDREGDHLPQSMHARVEPSRCTCHHPVGGHDLRQRTLNLALHGVDLWLELPATVRSAIPREEPAGARDGVWIRRHGFRSRA